VSIRTTRPESLAAGIIRREQLVALLVLRRSDPRKSGGVIASVRHAVEVPGLWTPGRRCAESEGRRGGRPQALGNLAGDRCRPCLRRGREIPTLPQRIVILAMINREHEGVTSQPGYTLGQADGGEHETEQTQTGELADSDAGIALESLEMFVHRASVEDRE